MAINNRSCISSTTNLGGLEVDAEQAYRDQCSEKHNDGQPQSHTPWATTYVAPLLEETVTPVAPDPAIQKANKLDLKIRNIPTIESK
jgi:hypothetical protein